MERIGRSDSSRWFMAPLRPNHTLLVRTDAGTSDHLEFDCRGKKVRKWIRFRGRLVHSTWQPVKKDSTQGIVYKRSCK